MALPRKDAFAEALPARQYGFMPWAETGAEYNYPPQYARLNAIGRAVRTFTLPSFMFPLYLLPRPERFCRTDIKSYFPIELRRCPSAALFTRDALCLRRCLPTALYACGAFCRRINTYLFEALFQAAQITVRSSAR